MSNGEKMVWAATFAHVLAESASPHHAVIKAKEAVDRLRDFTRLDDRNYGIELAREMVNG